jgi:hypothetical protein
MIQGQPNEMRWKDKGHDHCDCAIEKHVVSGEESKEMDPQ